MPALEGRRNEPGRYRHSVGMVSAVSKGVSQSPRLSLPNPGGMRSLERGFWETSVDGDLQYSLQRTLQTWLELRTASLDTPSLEAS